VADNKELIDLLRTVIKEELQPIRKEIAQEFKQVTGRLDCLENGQKQLQKDAKNIKTELQAIIRESFSARETSEKIGSLQYTTVKVRGCIGIMMGKNRGQIDIVAAHCQR
jgi:hypothetical protein